MEYKLSVYNVYLTEEHSIYNSHTKRIYALDESLWDKVSLLKNSKNSRTCGTRGIKPLVDAGIMVPAGQDEHSIVSAEGREYFRDDSKMLLTLLPTFDCNFRCIYCYEQFSPEMMSRDTEDAIVKYIGERARGLSDLSIGWFGGEPLLNLPLIKRLSFKIMAMCYKHSVRFKAGITTNGYLLDKNTFQVLLSCGVTRFHVTLDGGSRAHNICRPLIGGGETFDTIWSNLRDIRDCIEDVDFQLTVRINANNFTNETREEFMTMFAQEFGSMKQIGLQITSVADYGGEAIPHHLDMLSSKSDESLWRDIAVEKGIRMHDLEDTFLSKQGAVCYTAFCNHLVISPDSILRKCTCYLYEEMNRVGVVENKIVVDAESSHMWHTLGDTEDRCRRCVSFPLCFGHACPKRNVIDHHHPCSSDISGDALIQNLRRLCKYSGLVEPICSDM